MSGTITPDTIIKHPKVWNYNINAKRIIEKKKELKEKYTPKLLKNLIKTIPAKDPKFKK